MCNWLIPCSVDVFRIHDYFANNDIVDWKQSHYKLWKEILSISTALRQK